MELENMNSALSNEVSTRKGGGSEVWYKLDGRTPVPCDADEAEELLRDSDSRRVWFTKLPDCEVSTVFLVLNHNHFGDGPPILFETMIFGGSHDLFQWRYSAWNEAAEGHADAVRLACGEIDSDDGQLWTGFTRNPLSD